MQSLGFSLALLLIGCGGLLNLAVLAYFTLRTLRIYAWPRRRTNPTRAAVGAPLPVPN